ncbi:helix-turn-helix transcriptional regulator [Leucobacter sp. W1478]|uniref:helix-turn-helix transcriptional regulator n=1 Tax=Leucobacter sp. W1478 TaxID=3439065 RepID=UPI003F31BAF2
MREPDLEELRFTLMRYRKMRGWTLDELAEYSGVGRRTLVQLESGKSNGSIETWFRLAEVFGVHVGELLSALYGAKYERPMPS